MHNERLRQGREALAKHDMCVALLYLPTLQEDAGKNRRLMLWICRGELKMLRDTTGDKFAQLKR